MLQGSAWLVGAQFSIADMAAAPFVLRIGELAPAAFDRMPNVRRWWNAVQQRPSFAIARLEGFDAAVARRASSSAAPGGALHLAAAPAPGTDQR